MTEQFAPISDDVTLCFETFGDPAAPTVLLIMGLGTQMIAWDDAFCAMLVDRGFHVVRFDNRDCGRSSRMMGRPPGVRQLILRDPSAATYTLSDMAGDAVGLLDHLGVRRAHVVGASMGGMIAQTVAIEHPDRVLSLVSIMSNSGGRLSGQPALALYPMFLQRPPRDRDAYVEHAAALFARIGSRGELASGEAHLRDLAARAYDRGLTAAGTGRQLAAVLADRGRGHRLKAVAAPTLVIHGTADRLVQPSGGRATAKAVPGARLMLVDDMGHDLPPKVWERVADAIADNAARAAAPAAAA